MPTRFPFASTTGPPPLPGLSAPSICTLTTLPAASARAWDEADCVEAVRFHHHGMIGDDQCAGSRHLNDERRARHPQRNDLSFDVDRSVLQTLYGFSGKRIVGACNDSGNDKNKAR